MGSRIILSAGLLLLVCGPAAATSFVARVVDQDGKPVANAVISLVADGKEMPGPATRLDPAKVVDQRDETFIPVVTILPRTGRVVFANNDKTKHQVYSFSPIKQFEITLAQGERSPSFAFDKTGVAVLGCNIHDHMIAYVFVSDSPWTALTGSDGQTMIADVPPGNYDVQVWHPQLSPGAVTQAEPVTLTGETTEFSARLKLLSPPPMMHMHMGHY
jgi:plastocyanin